MNKIVDKFFLAGKKLMRELHLRQPRFCIALVDRKIKHSDRIK